eukprot:TRINITY_DN3307_c0_g1_i1.p1 TRINITY_DN3307_c0_g1~~TRINITY_DN3307_c0_g1_i1.p1  ORF type:complete len:164 (+),score=13.79 TRINITY_DN3307_c0_g1_i1:234-725(+)
MNLFTGERNIYNNIQSSYWDKIPHFVISIVLEYLDVAQLSRFSRVCKKFKVLGEENNLWKNLYKKQIGVLNIPSSINYKVLLREKIKSERWEKPVYSVNLLDSIKDREELKISIIGDRGVGKSTSALRFVMGLFIDEHDPTIDDKFLFFLFYSLFSIFYYYLF